MVTRERYVWVCTNRRPDGHPKGSCAAKGSEELVAELKAACAAAGLAKKVRVMASGCIDLCEEGIVAAALPEDVLVGHLSRDDVPALAAALAEPDGLAPSPFGARVLLRLPVHRDAGGEPPSP